ncbi:hypothetical protein T11_7410 [Trichinella zimbabwensis]|uniref:Uncharacterized protein n=1 Tax=Trichinella zimbabwensis TaxID=268475 RepID=A0A0V1H4M7_9BILA|nr:hypothetical protein T11_7410 [Trichinella zimbabwensis]
MRKADIGDDENDYAIPFKEIAHRLSVTRTEWGLKQCFDIKINKGDGKKERNRSESQAADPGEEQRHVFRFT